MSILPQELHEDRIKELCLQRCPESQTLEFKQALPGLNDKDKSEFLKDVCALANSDGGDLVYGVAEEEGAAKEPRPVTGESADAAKRRLGQILDAGLEPRLVGLRFQEVPMSDGGYVLVVRVPASYRGPHRYGGTNLSRFVMRNGTHTVDLSYDQLRSAFDRNATLADRARDFREDRLKAIAAGKVPKPILEGPICVLHLIPLAAMAGNRSLDIQALNNNYTGFMFNDWGGASRSTNLDGLVVYTSAQADGRVPAFVQVFRSGALEAVRYGGASHDPTHKHIPSSTVSFFFRAAIEKFIGASRTGGFFGPAIVGAAVLGVGGYEFALGQRFFAFTRAQADRNDLVLPEMWIEDIEAVSTVDDIARPLLDVMWQAFDVERCHLYDDTGKWNPR